MIVAWKNSQKGSVLVLSFFLILILTSYSIALYLPGLSRNRAVQFHRDKIRALNIAEAGFAQAVFEIKNGESGILGAEAAPIPYAGGVYYSTVSLSSESEILTLKVWGQFRKALVVLTHHLNKKKENVLTPEGKEDYVPPVSILIGGDGANTLLKNKTTIEGENGGIHSNGKIIIQGGKAKIKSISSSKPVTVFPGVALENENFEELVEPIEIPRVEPEKFKKLATFIFENDGKIYNQDGVFVHDAQKDGSFQHWNLSSIDKETNLANWELDKKGNPEDGFFYFEGNVKVHTNIKDNGFIWKVSLVASGHIDIQGKLVFSPYHPDKIGLIAGTDLALKGNSLVALSGIYAAKEQFEIRNGVQLEGVLIAENSQQTDQLISENYIMQATINGSHEDFPIPIALENSVISLGVLIEYFNLLNQE